MPVPGERERTVVVHLGKAEPAVLLGDLHAQCAEALQPVDHALGNPRLTLDLERVDLGLEEFAQLGQESLSLLHRLRIETRLGMDQIEPEVAQEQFLGEARQLPLRLARGLRDLARLPF